MPSGHKPECISSVMPLAYSAQGNNAHPYRPQGNRTVFTPTPHPTHSSSMCSLILLRGWLAVCLSICSTGRLYDDDVSGPSATELYECKLRSRPSWNLECCRAVRAVYAIQSSADRHLMMELVRGYVFPAVLCGRKLFPTIKSTLYPPFLSLSLCHSTCDTLHLN